MPRGTFIKRKVFSKKKLFGRSILAAAAMEILEKTAAGAAGEQAAALKKIESEIKSLKQKQAAFSINFTAVSKLITFFRVFSYRKAKAGFFSRGKKLRRKKFWAVYGGPEASDRTPARSPVPGFMASGTFQEIKRDFADDIRAAGIKYFNAVKERGSGGSPVSIRQALLKKYANHIAALLRSRRLRTARLRPPACRPGAAANRKAAI